jgi:hypothetical protein
MSNLKQKSAFNYIAAELLIKESLYAPSVHCSYYACFQLLKHIINDFFGVDYASQAQQISSSGLQTHQYVVNFITKELKQLAGIEESRKFKRTINDLKQFRVESDYQDIEVGSVKGIEAFSKAKEIMTYLKNFKV